MKAYIAASEYFSKNVQSFGVGVRAAATSLIALRDAVRKNSLAAKQWYEISIPDNDKLLNLDNFPDEKSLAPIITPKALLLVFRREAKVLGWQLDNIFNICHEGIDYNEAIEDFYKEKKDFLLSLPTTGEILSFLTGRCHDVAITSAFCNAFGIKGIRYSDKDGERFLIFDARNEIVIDDIKRSRDE